MRERYDKIVLEAGKGVTFEVISKDNKLKIKALTIATPSHYSADYIHPPIPSGYKHIGGDWWHGYAIKRISDGSFFTWVPVAYLNDDGTIDGEHFSEKFGRRNYLDEDFSEKGYYEPLSEELLKQFESVKKYGGFYISSFNISKGKDGKLQSVRDAMPLVNIPYKEVVEIASSFENTSSVKSHLVYGAEYDSILAWFIKSDIINEKQILESSSDWGNIRNKTVALTGSNEKWKVFRIWDLAGNVDEFTQEKIGSISNACVVRGDTHRGKPVAFRCCESDTKRDEKIGFRVALYIE